MDAQGLGDTDDVVGESLLPAEAAERPACPKAAEQRVGEKGGFRSLPHSDPHRERGFRPGSLWARKDDSDRKNVLAQG
jgi:hypothetical protein